HGLDPWASTPWGGRDRGVDARIKSAQDEFSSFPGSPTQISLPRKSSPDSPVGDCSGQWLHDFAARLDSSLPNSSAVGAPVNLLSLTKNVGVELTSSSFDAIRRCSSMLFSG